MGMEIKLFNQIFDREIDNLVSNITRSIGFGAFEGKACEMTKNFAHQKFDPYIAAFMGGDGKIDTDTATEFAKEKALSEIEAFKAKLKKEE